MPAVKKKFFEIELPVINQKAGLLAVIEKELVGRSIKIDLTRRLRGKSLEAVFKIKLDGEKIKAEPYRLHLLGYFIRRMMRKSLNYVEDSFPAECKNAVLRIKPFLITRKKVSRAVRKALRNKAREEIEKSIKEKEYEEIFSDLLSNKFQRSLSLKLKKIYPLSLCEIRDIFVEKVKSELKIIEEKVGEK
jgi:ribosomal protein S3AE